MKKIILAAILSAFPIFAVAHGGGTDAYGCHIEKKTGIRHCH